MPAIPSIEPTIIVAGDTVQWTKSIPDYPATDGWTLTYDFQLPGSTASPITFNASSSGAGYSVTLAKGTTDDWTTPGDYLWTSTVGNGTARHTVERGTVTIVSDPAAAYGATHATRTLAIIELALEGRLPRGLEMYTIGGQQVQRISSEALSRLRDKYKAEVKAEIDAARVASGLASHKTMWARFRSVQ